MRNIKRRLLVFFIISVYLLTSPGLNPALYALSEEREREPTAEDYYRMWLIYFDRGDYENAIPFMRKAIELDPSYSAKIRTHIDTSIEEELVYLALTEGTATAEDYYRMWLIYFDRGDYENAIPFMRKAIELDPSYSAKIRARIDGTEEELLAALVESKKKEVLAEAISRELAEKRKGAEEKAEMRPLKFGPLTLKPNIKLSFTWDDNILLSDADRRADYIMRFAPGFGAQLDLPFALPIIAGHPAEAETPRTLFNFEYIPEWVSYFMHQEDSNFGHTFVGTTLIPSNLFGGAGKLIFGFKEVFKFATYPSLTEDAKFVPRYDNEMEAKVKYTPREKISISLGYSNILEWYKQEIDQDFNYDKNILTPALYYNMTPKSALFIETDLGKITYRTGNRDSLYIQLSGGVSGNITPKTNVYFRAGVQMRRYDHPELYGDYLGFVTTGSLSSWLRRDILMKILFTKTVVESAYQGNAYFDMKYAELELIKQLTGKTSLTTGVNFGRNDYARDSSEGEFGIKIRRDYIWGVRGGLSYKLLRWLDSNTTYEFRGRNSCFDNRSYRDNRVMLNLKASY